MTGRLCDVSRNGFDIFFLLERAGHRIHPKATSISGMHPARAAFEILELRNHVPLVHSRDCRSQGHLAPLTLRAVALLAKSIKAFASLQIRGLRGSGQAQTHRQGEEA